MLLLLLLSALSPPVSNPYSPLLPIPLPTGCTEELVSMSPCLSYISEPPNDVASEPSDACCLAFNGRSLSGGNGMTCLCHLVREPMILGFPINASRIFALFGSCDSSSSAGIISGGGAETAAAAFGVLCKMTGAIPPLRSPSPAVGNFRGVNTSAPAPAPTAGRRHPSGNDCAAADDDYGEAPPYLQQEEEPLRSEPHVLSSSAERPRWCSFAAAALLLILTLFFCSNLASRAPLRIEQ